MAILIMVISNHINYLSWINNESYISIRHYITCIYQIPGFLGSTTFKLNFQSPPGDLSMHSCRMAKNWNIDQPNQFFRSQQDFEYLWIFVDSIQQGIFGKKKTCYIYIHTLHCIALHYITLHCIALHYITYIHTISYNYITLHYIHTYNIIQLHYITYIHYVMIYIYTYIYIYT
jgi:hypothetical protein